MVRVFLFIFRAFKMMQVEGKWGFWDTFAGDGGHFTLRVAIVLICHPLEHLHTHTHTHTHTDTLKHTCYYYCCYYYHGSTLTRYTDDQHEVQTTLQHFAFGHYVVQR